MTGSPHHSDPCAEQDGAPTGTPRWVKIFGAVALAVVLLLVVLLVLGGHGPGRHS